MPTDDFQRNIATGQQTLNHMIIGTNNNVTGHINFDINYVHLSYGLAFAMTRQMIDEEPGLQGIFNRAGRRAQNRVQVFHDIEPEDL